MTTVAQPPTKGYRTIRLPLAEHEYERFLTDRPYAKARLQELYEDYPELFPEAFPWGHALYGFTDPSSKQHLRCRRLRLNETKEVFTVAPAFVMPYRSGRVEEVEKALFLMRFIGTGCTTAWDVSVLSAPRCKPLSTYPRTWWRMKNRAG